MIAGLRDYARAHPWAIDIALLVLLTACAAAMRLTLLGDIPYGVHSDEAQVGTDAHRIISDGWIGVYTHAALGQPAGHAYLTVPSIWLLGDNAFALRLPLALVAVAQIPLLYLLVRVLANRLEAFLAAALLTVSYWQMFYSRVAHWSISYGTIVLAALLCLALGMKSGRRRWFVAAGALLGLGVYTYNIYPIALVAVAAFLAAMTWTRRDDLRPWLARLALTTTVAFVVALPMIRYVSDPDAFYWDHVTNYSEVDVTRSPEFRQASAWGKAKLIGEQARTFVEAYTWRGQLDNVDGNGLRPMFDPPTLLLLVAGLVLAVRRRREPMVIAALCCFFIIPLPAVLQRGSIMRQPVAAAPFAMYIAALPLAEAVRATRSRPAEMRTLAAASVAGFIALIATITVRDYFWTWRKDNWPRYVYFSQMTSASISMRDLPGGTHVLFLSERASINLEARQFLAPDVRGEDRSLEFGRPAATIEPPPGHGPIAYVLLGPYIERLPEIEAAYPGGIARTIERDGKLEFAAYELGSGRW